MGTPPRILGIGVFLVLLTILLTLESRSSNSWRNRLEPVRTALATAGFAEADIQRSQAPTLMSICDVGQIRKRGRAYHWRADTAEGLYCAREDGRADNIILLQGTPSTVMQPGAPAVVVASPETQSLARTVR